MDNQIAGELLKQSALLRQEFNHEREAYKKQAEYTGILKLVSRGICWYPVDTEHRYYNSLNRLVVEIQRLTQPDEDTEHQFEPGRVVTFFVAQDNNSLDYLNIIGRVNRVEEGRMVVELDSFEAYTALRGRSNLGVQLHFDNNSYKHMFTALSETINAKGNRLAHLRDTLLGTSSIEIGNANRVAGFSWLNKSQELAVQKVLNAKETAIIHGPPGTGKTTTLVETIYETLRRENQVLVCAQSNTAVDWISEKLVDRGIKVLRIGNPTKVNEKMLSFTYERQFAMHPLFGQLKRARTDLRALYNKKRKKGGDIRDKIAAQKGKIDHLEYLIENDLFSEARVIASTLVGAANRELTSKRFSTLFIDEAAQALEAACWIPISKCDRVVFAGDHHQLPPTVKCVEALYGGLGHSLMQKVAVRHPEIVSLLAIQYRMHRDIMTFSSNWFYHGKMIAAPEVSDRTILQFDQPVVWYDTHSLESKEVVTATGGKLNVDEARIAVEMLKKYIREVTIDRMIDERIDIGIISPYRAQVIQIRRLIKRDKFFSPIRSLLTIHTVDGFQGQERDVIMVSLVRSNAENEIGFLGDLRRMNVAITRARMKLIVIGDRNTLSCSSFYRSFHDYVLEREGVIEVGNNNMLKEDETN
ncbi:MAG: AAA domain-containing protein [Marinifilaceae bacterium]